MSFIRYVRIDWILIGTLPIILALISDRWMFLPVQYWFDPWGALGAYLDYEYLSSLHPKSYCLARLPSIIPHFFAYKFLTSYWAVVTTTLLKFYLCIIPLYWTLFELTKKRLASLIPIFLLSFFPFFLSSMGWHYVDGFGIAYISLATAFFLAACQKDLWKLWLFLAGFFQAMMVFNYLFVVVFAILQVVTFIAYNQVHKQRPLWVCAMFLGLGALFGTACLSSFSYYFNGSFLFFLPQIEAALHLSSETYFVRGQASVWYMPFKEWFPKSTFLFLTGLSFLFSVFYLFERLRKNSILNLHSLMVIQFLVACLIYIIQDVMGIWMLQNFFVASYLLPFSTLALGVILSDRLPRFKHESWVLCGVFGIFSIAFALKGNAAVIGRSWGCVMVYFAGCVIFSALLLRTSKNVHKIIYASFVILFTVLAFNRLTKSKDHYPYKDHVDHTLLVDLHRHIKKDIPAEGPYLFWYNLKTDELSSFFQPLACTYLGTLFSNNFPEICAEVPLQAKATIILASSDPDAVQKAEKALKQKGYHWSMLTKEEIQLGPKKFLLLAFLLALPHLPS